MLARTRTLLIDAVGALFALISLAFAVTAVAGFGFALYGAVAAGSVLKPLLIGTGGFALALVTRFLAELDKYEYVPQTTTTTTRRSTGGTRRTK